jgi:Trypsin-like peptidase domain
VYDLHNLLRVLSTALLLSSLCPASNVKDHVVGVHRTTIHVSFPITTRSVYGSGICINRDCSIIATAYHVQLLAGRRHLQVAGGHTDKVLSLGRDGDTNTYPMPIAGSKTTVSYNVANDVSFVYTKKAIAHKTGVQYSYKYYVGQQVIIAGYCDNEFRRTNARIIGSNVSLVNGQARLNENLIVDVKLDAGTSGSGVFDDNGNLLGMIVLTGALKFSSGDLTASVALPVRTIAKALVKVDPAIGSIIFNNIPEEEPKPTPQSYVLYQDSDLPEDTSPVIPELAAISSEMPSAVGRLHTVSKAASTRMVNFISRQCMVQGTQEAMCYELSIENRRQRFRLIGRNGKLGRSTKFFPVQAHGVWIQSDWADTLGDIATKPWVFRGLVVDHYLFTLESTAEDDHCYWEEYSQGTPLFGGGHPAWKGAVACDEQILTDKDFNVLFVFTELYPPDDCLARLVQQAASYDWISLEGLKSPILLPVKERITAKVQGQKDLWYTNVSWTGYRKFRAEHKIKF